MNAKVARAHTLELTFNDGSVKEVDFLPYIEPSGVFAPLKDEDYAASVSLARACGPSRIRYRMDPWGAKS